VVTIEQEEDGGGLGKPSHPVLEDPGAEESDRIGESCLREAHGSPGTFDDNDSPVEEGLASGVTPI